MQSVAEVAVDIGGERARLERLCFRLCGSMDAAEDLAQETLVEAWRLQHRLHEPEGRQKWLNAIARNVCMRWTSRHIRERRQFSLPNDGFRPTDDPIELPSDDPDLTVELERSELALLLDRAMAQLPRTTRDVLIERYVKDSPQAEIASRLGLSEGAVELRLHRGKLALRKVLATDFYAEASSYRRDLLPDPWEETRIWCPGCGGRRLLGLFSRNRTTFMLRCPGCNDGQGHLLAHWVSATLFADVKGHKSALSRLASFGNSYYRQGLRSRSAPCRACGKPARVSVVTRAEEPAIEGTGVLVRCAACGARALSGLEGLNLCLPEAQRFWRDHPRMRAWPEREIELAGTAAIITTFESASNSARLEVVSRVGDLEVLAISGLRPGA